jgi:heterokaryon incompatibility protein Het-C
MLMVKLRRWSVVLAFVVGTALPASAFKFDIHVEMTYDAIAAVLTSLPADVRQKVLTVPGLTVNGFSMRAVQEIAAANKARDTGDCARPDDYTVIASACGQFDGVGSQTKEALLYLKNEPAEDHFDDERIEESNNLLIQRRQKIIEFLRAGNFVGARKMLGSALHALQDFYSHSNYVELGLGEGGTRLEPRLGRSSFLRGTFAEKLPRVADATQQTCWQGSQPFNNALRLKLRSMAGGPTSREVADAIAAAEEFMRDPRLTTGFFYAPVLDPLDEATKEKVETYGKCRHGWELLLEFQPGIHKDDRLGDRGTTHPQARTLGTKHSIDFIVGLITELMTDNPCQACVLGLMGYQPELVITGVSVGVPGAPNGASWDTALSSALGFFVSGTQGLKNIQPDIMVCTESTNVPQTCTPICDDADWSLELNAYVCTQPLGPSGFGALTEPDLRVWVREADRGIPETDIAKFRVEDPKACNPFCSLDLDPDRSIWIRFDIKPVLRYGGRRRPRPAILPPAETVPVAKPSASVSTKATTTPGPGSTTTTNSSSSSTSSTSASMRTSAAASPLRTAEEIDYRLALRDADNCSGADAFYPSNPPSSLTGAQRVQLYQLAAFSMAITDAAAKQAVLNAIRMRVGDDAFYTAMTSVIADPLQSQALLTAYQNTARNVVQQITANGLASLFPAPRPPSALLPDVDRWILSRLSSPTLVSSAVDLMAGARPITAECTLNELAKQGFIAAVLP